MKKLCFTLLCVTCMIALCCWVWVSDGYAQSTILDTTFTAITKGGGEEQIPALIYLPEGYDPEAIEKKYPLYIFLHGSAPDNHENRKNQMAPILDRKIANAEIDPMIVIWPLAESEKELSYGNRHMYTNSSYHGPFDNLISKDLFAWARTTFNVWDFVALGGFSMGGGGAQRMCLRHDEINCIALVSHSAEASLDATLPGDGGNLFFNAAISEAQAQGTTVPPPFEVYMDGLAQSPPLFNTMTILLGVGSAFSPSEDENNPYGVDFPFRVDEAYNIIDTSVYDEQWLDLNNPINLLANRLASGSIDIGMFFTVGEEDPAFSFLNGVHQAELAALNYEKATFTTFPGGHFPGDDRIDASLQWLNAAFEEEVRVATDTEHSPLPENAILVSNYPNPFSEQTHIQYTLTTNDYARIDILDMTGRRIKTLVDKQHIAGKHEVTWKAAGVPSGVYSVRLHTNDSAISRLVILIR